MGTGGRIGANSVEYVSFGIINLLCTFNYSICKYHINILWYISYETDGNSL